MLEIICHMHLPGIVVCMCGCEKWKSMRAPRCLCVVCLRDMHNSGVHCMLIENSGSEQRRTSTHAVISINEWPRIY